ncbi:hypothetical protein [Mocis latipes granulovirus]|uniref:Uncharacterized protein n=1 Tax=Mocis latipes granulovirus TaxID=2072024 RepID=A0A162GWD5_9BBAC|nr:hypothetical protein [Mocis latipes granulovirus]AKR17477.1 hypothetical protein [Mocis latipes granulovirus]
MSILVQPVDLIELTFEKCLMNNLKVTEYLPSGIVLNLLHQYIVRTMWTSEKFRRVLLNYAYTNDKFGDVLNLLLTTNVCNYVYEMVDDEERVDDVINSRGRWTFEDVFDFVMFVKIRDITNTQYIFYEHLRLLLFVSGDVSLCRFCVKQTIVEERYFNVDNQCDLSEILLDPNNYCAKCHGPMFILSEIDCGVAESTLCDEEL